MPFITEVKTSKPGLRPLLVDFQNGKIQPEKNCNIKASLYKNKDDKLVIGVTTSNMLYAGRVDNEDDLYNNFVLIHNKKKNKARLVQVDYTTLSPFLTKKKTLLNTSLSPRNSAIADLNKQFGSKKTKRHTEMQERLKMNIDTVKEDLEKTVSAINTSEFEQLPQVSENDSLYRPKINREASTRDQVYFLDSLVPENVLSSLSKEAEAILESDDVEEFRLTPFVKSQISRVTDSAADDGLKVSKINILLYINYLIKFMNTPMKNITKKFVVCEGSAEVNNHILDNYSVNTGHSRTRPLTMKDKSLCFILVLAALAMDFEVDVELLSKDLKMGIKKVQEICRILAFSSTSNKNVVVLKLPLPAEVTFSAKRKRR